MTATTEAQAPALLHNFYLTFGVQYRHTPHPYWNGAHPDGWVLIQAPDEAAARKLAVRYFGYNWSTTYDALNFNEAENQQLYYELGCIASLTTDGECRSFIDGVDAPVPHVTNSDPEYHGVDSRDVVGYRIEGHLKVNPDEMYDVRLFHRNCAEEGREMFEKITEEDSAVRAFELDWASPAKCDQCGRVLS